MMNPTTIVAVKTPYCDRRITHPAGAKMRHPQRRNITHKINLRTDFITIFSKKR
jgi:hypothetical protein